MILTQQVPPNVDPARLAIEVAALRAAAAHAVPVAPVVDSADQTGVLGVPYLITERITGESIPRRILRGDEFAAARGQLAHHLGEVLARIHAIPTSQVPGLELTDPLQVLEDLYETIDEPRPVVEIGLQLAATAPPGAHTAECTRARRFSTRQPADRTRGSAGRAGLGSRARGRSL